VRRLLLLAVLSACADQPQEADGDLQRAHLECVELHALARARAVELRALPVPEDPEDWLAWEEIIAPLPRRKDPWGQEYRYVNDTAVRSLNAPPNPYDYVHGSCVVSSGPDGKAGTEDDIKYPYGEGFSYGR